MAELPRRNGSIKALEEGGVAFVGSAPADGAAGTNAPYDGALFEMEHGPYDIRALQEGLQSMLDRRQIAQRGLAPAVTPIVRIPPNQGQTNWVAKQVLDIGVYGIIWPHVDTVEEAYNAVAAMRYPRVEGRPLREPFGRRGDAPQRAVTYWGITQQEYYARADVWPLNPQGELLCCLMIESPEGIGNLPKMLAEVPGIGVIFTGEGDLSQELGHPRQYDHPDVRKGVKDILDICKAHRVPNGWFHTTLDNVEQVIRDGYRVLMAPSSRSYAVLHKGRTAAGRR
jgi:4-hydroxy-2-oxoheptanedioate aldolase